MKIDQILQLYIDDIKFPSDELFKDKNIPIFVYIIKTIDIWTNRTTNLPSISELELFQTVNMCMKILKFTDINKILRLHEWTKKFKMSCNISLFGFKIKIFKFITEFLGISVNKSSKFVVLKTIHKSLLI